MYLMPRFATATTPFGGFGLTWQILFIPVNNIPNGNDLEKAPVSDTTLLPHFEHMPYNGFTGDKSVPSTRFRAFTANQH